MKLHVSRPPRTLFKVILYDECTGEETIACAYDYQSIFMTNFSFPYDSYLDACFKDHTSRMWKGFLGIKTSPENETAWAEPEDPEYYDIVLVRNYYNLSKASLKKCI